MRQFRSVKVDADLYQQIKQLCDTTGHKIGFHMDRALKNYLSDEAPVWRKAAQETRKLHRTK